MPTELYVAGHVGSSAQTSQQGPIPPRSLFPLASAVAAGAMAGGQVSIEDSVRMASMSRCADDAKQRAFDDAMVELGKTPLDLVSGDEDPPDAPCDQAPCDEKIPELKGLSRHAEAARRPEEDGRPVCEHVHHRAATDAGARDAGRDACWSMA